MTWGFEIYTINISYINPTTIKQFVSVKKLPYGYEYLHVFKAHYIGWAYTF